MVLARTLLHGQSYTILILENEPDFSAVVVDVLNGDLADRTHQTACPAVMNQLLELRCSYGIAPGVCIQSYNHCIR